MESTAADLESLPVGNCLFCATLSGKRSREHVLRRDFGKKFPIAPDLLFSHVASSGRKVGVPRPMSQFDMVVNHVCRDCNHGWLNDLENAAQPIIEKLGLSDDFDLPIALTSLDQSTLAYWAAGRALLRTFVSPSGRAPTRLFHEMYESRGVPRACRVHIARCDLLQMQAGTHTSQQIELDGKQHYVAVVTLSLGHLMVCVQMSEIGAQGFGQFPDGLARSRTWFPDALIGIWPTQQDGAVFGSKTIASQEALAIAFSDALLNGIRPIDLAGNQIDFRNVIPARFHEEIGYKPGRHDDHEMKGRQ